MPVTHRAARRLQAVAIALATFALIAATVAAVDVSFDPAGSISATNVQAMGEELDSEKLALDGSQAMTGDLDIGGVDRNIVFDKIQMQEHDAGLGFVGHNLRVFLDDSGLASRLMLKSPQLKAPDIGLGHEYVFGSALLDAEGPFLIRTMAPGGDLTLQAESGDLVLKAVSAGTSILANADVVVDDLLTSERLETFELRSKSPGGDLAVESVGGDLILESEGGDLLLNAADAGTSILATADLVVEGALTTDSGGSHSGLHDFSAADTRLRTPVVAATANATLGASDVSGVLLTNEGASGSITFTLPSAVAGMTVSFAVASSSALLVAPDGTDAILRMTDASGDAISSSTVGSSVTLVALNSAQWVVTAETGAWMDAN